ncbi:MAG: putative metal-binding motif-containing protein [Candidatus Diapherotrites archaeon]|nr:putative metal-binding motif-containing protein [Candidatus Diapherotrites archaeon]
MPLKRKPRKSERKGIPFLALLRMLLPAILGIGAGIVLAWWAITQLGGSLILTGTTPSTSQGAATPLDPRNPDLQAGPNGPVQVPNAVSEGNAPTNSSSTGTGGSESSARESLEAKQNTQDQESGSEGSVLGAGEGSTENACDEDVDGYPALGSVCGGTDCDDANPFVNPGVIESCNALDDNCNDFIDEGLTGIDCPAT